jgi:hypothetical protein
MKDRISCSKFTSTIQNQIIHKHVNVDYNPLKGMVLVVLISSLKLWTVPYAAGPESRGH